jgi:biopolymer transport protein ExbD
VEQGVFRPQLTSLVDVMTILLVFLIKSFSVEGTIITPSDDLRLPVSTSDKPPRVRCSIVITQQAIMAEGEVLVPFKKISEGDSLLIPALFSYMKSQYQRTKSAGQQREVIIQCDREVKYVYVKKVMYTCSKAGFTDYSVLVLQED